MVSQCCAADLPLHGSNRRRQRLIYLAGLTLFGLATAWIFMLSVSEPDLSSEYGIVIPDVSSMRRTLVSFGLDSPPWSRAHELPGPWLLYGSWLAPSPAYCIAVNSILMVCAARIWWTIAAASGSCPGWAVVALIANPYLPIAMLGPNKEIPVLLLTLAIFRMVLRRSAHWVVRALVVCSITYLFRDGYAVMLAMWLLAVWWSGHNIVRASVLLMVAGCGASVMSFEIAEHFHFVRRQVMLAEDSSNMPAAAQAFFGLIGVDSATPLLQPVLLCVRVFYNAVSQAFFPIMTTEASNVHVLGVAYWMNGLLVLVVIVPCIVVLRGSGGGCGWNVMSASLVSSMVVLSSVSPQIQPRYFMPLWPMAFAVIVSTNRRLLLPVVVIALVLTGVVIGAYRAMGYPPARAQPIEADALMELSLDRP